MADSTSCANEGDGRSWVSVRERRVGASNARAGRTKERRGSHLFQSRATRRVVRRERLRVVFSSGGCTPPAKPRPRGPCARAPRAFASRRRCAGTSSQVHARRSPARRAYAAAPFRCSSQRAGRGARRRRKCGRGKFPLGTPSRAPLSLRACPPRCEEGGRTRWTNKNCPNLSISLMTILTQDSTV